jgi:hypothetical protein
MPTTIEIQIKTRRRVKALLSKTVANGATEEEAKSAKALAAELTAKYLPAEKPKVRYSPELHKFQEDTTWLHEVWEAEAKMWDGTVKKDYRKSESFAVFELAARMFEYTPNPMYTKGEERTWFHGHLIITVVELTITNHDGSISKEFDWIHSALRVGTKVNIKHGKGIESLKTHLWNFHHQND